MSSPPREGCGEPFGRTQVARHFEKVAAVGRPHGFSAFTRRNLAGPAMRMRQRQAVEPGMTGALGSASSMMPVLSIRRGCRRIAEHRLRPQLRGQPSGGS